MIYYAGALIGNAVNKKKKKKADNPLFYRALFLAGVILFFNILNILTVKTALLPVLYFPALDRVFGTLVEDRELIGKCIAFSMQLLFKGVFGGLIIGFFMGIAVGFSKTAAYWINPIIRILGHNMFASLDTDPSCSFHEGEQCECIHHRYFSMVPDSRTHFQRYFKRKEFLL